MRGKVGVPRCWFCDAEVADSGSWCPWPYECLALWKAAQAKAETTNDPK